MNNLATLYWEWLNPALPSAHTKQSRWRGGVLCAPALAPWLPALRPPACFLVVIADVSPLCHTRLNRPLSSSWREKLKQRGALAWGLYRVKCGITSDTQTSETPPVPRGNAGRKRQSSIREPRWSQCNHSAGRSGGLLFGLFANVATTNKQTNSVWLWDTGSIVRPLKERFKFTSL